MGRPRRELIGVAGVLVFAATLWLPLSTHDTRRIPETLETALTLATTPPSFRQLDGVDPHDALLPSALLSALVVLDARVRDDVADRFALRSAVLAGDRGPVRAARRLWVALILLAGGLSALGATAWCPTPRHAAWMTPALACAVVCMTPVLMRTVTEVSPTVPSLVLTCAALAVLPRRGGAMWRTIVGGLLIGAAVSGSVTGFVALPLMLFAWEGVRRGESGLVRFSVLIIAAFLGAVAADVRLLDASGLLVTRVAGGGWLTPALGQPWLGSVLWRLVTVPALLLTAFGVVALIGRAGTRLLGVALTLVVGLAVALPGARADTLVPTLPAFALLTAAGFGRVLDRVSRPALRAIAVLAVAVTLTLPAVTRVREEGRPGNRALAAEWLSGAAPVTARVVTAFSGPELPSVQTEFVLPYDVRDPDVFHGAYDPAWYAAFDTFILMGDLEARFQSAPTRHAEPLAFFRYVRTHGQRVAEFTDGRGPTVEVYVRNGPAEPDSVVRRARRWPPDPTRVDFYVSLGAAYKRAGETRVAEALYETAIRVDPNDPRAVVNLSAVFLSEGNVSEADSLLRPRIRRFATHPQIRYQFGLVKYGLGLLGEAIGEYKMAVRYDPAFVDAHFNLGLCYFEAGNVSGARRSFARVTELANPDTHLYREAARMVREIDAL